MKRVDLSLRMSIALRPRALSLEGSSPCKPSLREMDWWPRKSPTCVEDDIVAGEVGASAERGAERGKNSEVRISVVLFEARFEEEGTDPGEKSCAVERVGGSDLN